MRIRHPWLIKAAGFGLACLLRLWMSTIRCHYRPLGPNYDPKQRGLGGRYIYITWHENLLLPLVFFHRRCVATLISSHADGRLAAEVLRHIGGSVVYGSTTRGGVEAVLRMVRLSGRKHLGVVPDGPRGPRRRLQLGVIYLAARTGLPIVPVGIGYDKPWRLRSWDRFAVPRPGSRGTCVTGPAVHVPADANRALLEEYRGRVEHLLNRLSLLAEAWAERGTWPEADDPPPAVNLRQTA